MHFDLGSWLKNEARGECKGMILFIHQLPASETDIGHPIIRDPNPLIHSSGIDARYGNLFGHVGSDI
jgi:hypothetical protein